MTVGLRLGEAHEPGCFVRDWPRRPSQLPHSLEERSPLGYARKRGYWCACPVAAFEPICQPPRQMRREPPPTIRLRREKGGSKGACDPQPQTFAQLRHRLAVLVIAISSVALH